MTNSALAEQFFLQIAIILLVCRGVGILARRMGQPQVVAEMIAGVCMGPLAAGVVFSRASESNFPLGQTDA